MSATSYIDDVIANAGEYAVYGKALGDKMRDDVQYGPDPRRPLYGDMVANPNSSRIAEIDSEIAELRAKLGSDDLEEAMGRYKFLYDADPSTLTSYRQQLRNNELSERQSLRNARQTEAIRKSNEQATKTSQLQSLWKQNNLDLEAERYTKLAAEKAFEDAKQSMNESAAKDALLALKKSDARIKRLERENDDIRSQILVKDFGQDSEPADYSSYESSLNNIPGMQARLNDIEREIKSIKTDNMKVTATVKKGNVDKWTKLLDESESYVNSQPVNETVKNKYLTLINEARDKVYEYSKPSSKGGQDAELTKEEFAKLSADKLVDLGKKALQDYKKRGYTNKFLEKAMDVIADK